MRLMLIILCFISCTAYSQTLSVDTSTSIGIEYMHNIYGCEISTDFESLEIIILNKVEYDNITIISGIGYNSEVFCKLGLETAFNIKSIEFRIEPTIYNCDDIELTIGINLFEIILTPDDINLGISIDI